MDEHGLEPTQILGQAPAFLDLLDQVSRVAVLDRPVLIVGERGTGKELIATRLNYLSQRWERRYVQLNCAALPETLLDSELFGYEPGAFTGASRSHAGRFELADGGTLFLDEIATLSMPAQEKLLRIIEYGRFERLGGSETIQVDVRIIGATNVDLPSEAEAGRFRHDLLDRLAFDVLTVPPLRERPEDIIELVDHFGRAMARRLDWPAYPGFTRESQKVLRDYDWPGNVRELKNVVERAVYRWPDESVPIGEITLDPFESPFRPKSLALSETTSASPPPSRDDPQKPDVDLSDGYRAAVATFEKSVLEEALKRRRFNQRDTARDLKLSYDQLRHALKKHDLN